MIYLNNAGTSWPKPAPVHRAVAAALEADPDTASGLLEASLAGVCRFLSIPDPSRFLFTTGCTSALSVALADLPWRSGDVVLTSSLEHHALVRPLQQLARHRGVRHVQAPYRAGVPIDLDFVSETLTRERVRLIAVTHASNVTGELLPVAALASLAHEHGALMLLDAAQTVGIVPVDVGRIGADIVAFAGHKGPLGPQGIGGLWAARPVTFESPEAACEIDAGGVSCASFPGYCDVGAVNLAGAAGLAAGLRHLTERGLEATGGRARRLAARLVSELSSREGCGVYGGADAERTGTVSLHIDNLELARAEARFLERGIVIRAGAHCAPLALRAVGAPEGTLRVSFGASSTEDDLAALLDAL